MDHLSIAMTSNYQEAAVEKARYTATLKIADDCASKDIQNIKQALHKKVTLHSAHRTDFRSSKQRSYSSNIKAKLKDADSYPLQDTPLLTDQELEDLNAIRSEDEDLTVRMFKSTKAGYNKQMDQQLINRIELLASSSNENWIKKPEISEVINHWEFKELRVSGDFPTLLKQKPVSYNPQKYCKEDLVQLQRWYKATLLELNSSPSPKTIAFINKVYYLHLAVIKEYIRVVSLESSQKGSILKQCMKGLLHLMNQLVDLQHSQANEDLKRNRSEMDDLKLLLDKNQDYLQQRVQRMTQELQLSQDKLNKLSVVYLSYKRVNQELIFNNNEHEKHLTKLSCNFQILKLEHFKLLNRLVEEGKIQEDSNRFYFVNKLNKPEVITHFVTGKEKYEDLTNNRNTIASLESELGRFWVKMEDTFATEHMVPDEVLFPEMKEISVQTNIYQLYSVDKSVQNYSLKSEVSDISLDEEEQLEGFLQREIKKGVMANKNNDLVITLKQLYEEVYGENLHFKKENEDLKALTEDAERQVQNMTKQVGEERKTFGRRADLLKQLREQNDKLYLQLADKDSQLQKAVEEGTKAAKDFANQRTNSEFLVKNLHEVHQKLQTLKRQSSNSLKEMEVENKRLRGKISKGCVVMNHYLDITESAIDKRHIEIGRKLSEIFKEELLREERDTDLFITKS